VSGDYWDDPEMQQWARRVSDEVVPMIRGSAATISIVPSGESDMKFAVELGLSIMMDKPIIIAVPAGVQVPSKLVLLADEIARPLDTGPPTEPGVFVALHPRPLGQLPVAVDDEEPASVRGVVR